jgi:hypothetical protein
MIGRLLLLATTSIALNSALVFCANSQVTVQETSGFNSPAITTGDGGRIHIEYKTFQTVSELKSNAQTSLEAVFYSLYRIATSQTEWSVPAIWRYANDPSDENATLLLQNLFRTEDYVELAIQTVIDYESALKLEASKKKKRSVLDVKKIQDLLFQRTVLINKIRTHLKAHVVENEETRKNIALHWTYEYREIIRTLADQLILMSKELSRESK